MVSSFRNWLKRQRTAKQAANRGARLRRRGGLFEALEDRRLLTFTYQLTGDLVLTDGFDHGNGSFDLIVETEGPLSPTGTLATSISGTYLGSNVTGLSDYYDASNLLYSGVETFDFDGLAFNLSPVLPGSAYSPDFDDVADLWISEDGNLYSYISNFEEGDFDYSSLYDILNFSILGISNEAPTAVTLTENSASLEENTDTTSAIELATVVLTDDGLGTNELSLSGTDAASFEIVGDKLYLKAGVSLDFETKTSYSVRINVDDTTVGSTPDAFADFTLTVTNVNETTVTDLIVQKGQEQRSFIRYIDLVFSDGGDDLLSMLSDNRISLIRYSLDGDGNSVSVPLPTPTVSGNTLQFDFGVQGLGGNQNTGAGDGFYQILLDYNGDEYLDDFVGFRRLFGDLNGDLVVDANDKKKAMSFIGKPYSGEGDANGDGVVNSADMSFVARAVGRFLIAPG